MPKPRPIDARQYVLWHRIRRWGPWSFVVGGGGVLAPLVTCLLFGVVIVYFHYPWSTYIRNSVLMWIITAPLYIGACFWTWKHMESRYHATLDLRCPGCGYLLHGRPRHGRCPECGTLLTERGELPAPEERRQSVMDGHDSSG